MPECPICFEQYSRLPVRQPRTLFCGHSICHKCAEKLIGLGKEANSQGVKCPKCRYISPVPGQKGFPINHDLLDALDEKALPSLQPSVLPSSISAVSSSAPVLASAPTCAEHSSETVKLYCTTCKKMICLLCRRGSHQHHKRQEIDEALQATLSNIKSRVGTVRPGLLRVHSEVKNEHKMLESQHQDLARLIATNAERAITAIRGREAQLTSALDRAVAEQAAHFDSMQRLCLSAGSALETVEQALANLGKQHAATALASCQQFLLTLSDSETKVAEVHSKNSASLELCCEVEVEDVVRRVSEWGSVVNTPPLKVQACPSEMGRVTWESKADQPFEVQVAGPLNSEEKHEHEHASFRTVATGLATSYRVTTPGRHWVRVRYQMPRDQGWSRFCEPVLVVGCPPPPPSAPAAAASASVPAPVPAHAHANYQPVAGSGFPLEWDFAHKHPWLELYEDENRLCNEVVNSRDNGKGHTIRSFPLQFVRKRKGWIASFSVQCDVLEECLYVGVCGEGLRCVQGGVEVGDSDDSWGYAAHDDAVICNDGRIVCWGERYGEGDVIRVAVNASKGTLAFFKNNRLVVQPIQMDHIPEPLFAAVTLFAEDDRVTFVD